MSGSLCRTGALQDKGRRKGSALVIALLVIAVLTGLTMGFSRESGVELSLAEFSRDGYEAYEAARSGVYFAFALLDHEKEDGVEELREEWSTFGEHPLPAGLPEGVTLAGGIIDESGKLNVNRLLDPQGGLDPERVLQLVRLFSSLGLEESRVVPLLDWLDSDSIERLDGAESHYYRELPEPYDCGNGPFETRGQIFLVKGFQEIAGLGGETQKGLLDYLTIHSNGKININSAPPEVLMSLSEDLDTMVAEAILEYREEEDFERVDDLRRVIGVDDALFESIRGYLSVEGSAYTIEIRAKCGEAVAGIQAVAVREQGALSLAYWRVE